MVLKTYKFILKHRQVDKNNIIFGDIEFLDIDSQEHFSYINHGESLDYLVICNFKDYPITINLTGIGTLDYHYFYSNSTQRDLMEIVELNAFEAYVYRKQNK